MALPTPLDPQPLDTTIPLDGGTAANARAVALGEAYGKLEAAPLLCAMIRDVFAGRIAVVSSFGAESAVLLELVARIDSDPSI